MTCTKCGREVVVDFRAQSRRCEGCRRGPDFCRCAPVVVGPRWRQRLTAKELTYAA